MEKLLQLQHLKHLNNNKFKKKAILLLFVPILLFSSFISKKGDDLPIINKETVRKDVLKHYKDFIYDQDFENCDTSTFYVQYIDGYCFVHIPYRTQQTSLKTSLLAIYYIKNKSWKYQTTIPYYDAFEILDQKNLIFLSDNEYCLGNGSCNYYCEVSKFIENDMLPVVNYYGYDNRVYYDFLLSKEEASSVLNVKGDTITDVISLSDFTFDNKGLKSYKLVRKIGILSGVKKDVYGYDSLVIKQSRIEKLINYKNP